MKKYFQGRKTIIALQKVRILIETALFLVQKMNKYALFVVRYENEFGYQNVIPLWAFGFNY